MECIADPATGEVLGTIPEMALTETKQAIDAAAEAFKAWSKTTAKVRLLNHSVTQTNILRVHRIHITPTATP